MMLFGTFEGWFIFKSIMEPESPKTIPTNGALFLNENFAPNRLKVCFLFFETISFLLGGKTLHFSIFSVNENKIKSHF